MINQSLIIWLVIILLLLVFFIGTEIAMSAANKFNIELKRKQGSLTGKILGRFSDNSHEFIATNLVGFTISLVIYTLLISKLLDPVVKKIVDFTKITNTTAYITCSLLVNIILATLLVIIIAELLPKALFKRKANGIVKLFALPMQLFHTLLYPIANLLTVISEFMLKYLFNVRIKEENEPFQRIDIDKFIKHSWNGIDPHSEDVNKAMLNNVLNLTDQKLKKCIIPRNEIVALPHTASVDVFLELFNSSQKNRIIVYNGSIDKIIGYVHILDFIKKPHTISDVLHTLPTIPETMGILPVMELLRKLYKPMGWVVDEYGGTAGIVTTEDIWEQIFGEINNEYYKKQNLEQQIAQNEYLLSGRLELQYLNTKYNFEFPETTKAETLSGYIINSLGSIPKAKDRIIIDHFEFDILLVSNTKIETIKLRILK